MRHHYKVLEFFSQAAYRLELKKKQIQKPLVIGRLTYGYSLRMNSTQITVLKQMYKKVFTCLDPETQKALQRCLPLEGQG